MEQIVALPLDQHQASRLVVLMMLKKLWRCSVLRWALRSFSTAAEFQLLMLKYTCFLRENCTIEKLEETMTTILRIYELFLGSVGVGKVMNHV